MRPWAIQPTWLVAVRVVVARCYYSIHHHHDHGGATYPINTDSVGPLHWQCYVHVAANPTASLEHLPKSSNWLDYNGSTA